MGLLELKAQGRWRNYQIDGYSHRDFVDKRASEFYQNCLRPLLGFEGNFYNETAMLGCKGDVNGEKSEL